MAEPGLAFAIGDAAFAAAIVYVHAERGRSILVGLSGSQGSGKSTTAARLAARLCDGGLRVALCSLDDFYLTRGERAALAADVHPLLATRGVPGTHDVALIELVLARLQNAGKGCETAIPQFDKATDDRAASKAWHVHRGRADIVLLEGWCVGARPQPERALAEPANALERDEDPDRVWRRYVNARLADDYAGLFSKIDLALMLRAPSFECVHRWRAEQETGLPRDAAGAKQPMDDAALARFIAHYERITRQLLIDEPAALIAELDEDRAPVRWCRKR